MAKLAGITGSVTIKIGEGVTVKEFSIPLDVGAVYDKVASNATLKVDTKPFNEAVAKLTEWINAFPDLA